MMVDEMEKQICNRDISVDLSRGVAAILMIVGHSVITYPIDISQIPWCKELIRFIYVFHMELFFLLAGAVYHCGRYGKYVKKKVNRIVIPYLFFGLLTLLVKAYGGNAVNGSENIGEGITKLIIHGGAYWFLYTIFCIFLMYPIIDKYCNAMLKIHICVICIGLTYIVPTTLPFGIYRICERMPFFILGDVVIKRIIETGGGYQKKWNLLRYACLLIFVVLFVFHMEERTRFYIVFKYIEGFSMCMFVYLTFRKLIIENYSIKSFFVIRKLKNFILACGKYSLQLYLFNGYLMTIARIVICNKLKISSPVIIILGISILNYVVTLGVCKFVIPKSKVLRRLTGL